MPSRWFVALGLLLISVTAVAEVGLPTLSVRGESLLMVAPDQVSINIGVTTEAKAVKDAMAQNTRKMQNIMQALQALSLTKDNYQTANFNVQPIWSQRPRNAEGDWRRQIVGYRVNNSLSVTSDKLAMVGDIIAKAAQAGSNQIHSIQFGLANPRQYREQAIEQAVANAKADATVLAKASGDRIKRTLSIALDNAVANPVYAQAEKFSVSARMADVTPPPVAAGDITVNASVSITYELH